MRLTFSAKISLLVSLVSSVAVILTGVLLSLIAIWRVEKDVHNELSVRANDLIRQHIVYEDGFIRYRRGPEGETISSQLIDFNVSAVVYSLSRERIGTYGLYRNLSDRSEIGLLLPDDLFTQVVTSQKPVYRDSTIESGRIIDTYTVPLLSAGTTIGIMQLAREATFLIFLRETFGLLLILILPLSVVVSWVLGYILSKKALSPLKRLIYVMRQAEVSAVPPPIHITGPSNDELYLLAHSFNEMLLRLKEGVEKQKNFISNASHELKTPLTRTISSLEIVSSDLDQADPQIISRVEQAKSTLLELAKTIDSLLTLARLQAAPAPTPAESISLYQSLHKIIRIYQEEYRQKNIEVALVCDRDIHIKFSPQRLNILLNNLLSNAFKYGKSGGKIHVLVTRENSFVSIRFSDDGPGMDADESRQMFHRFFRGRSQSRIPGSGLGLSLVDEIIKTGDLHLEVSSHPGQGTTITLSGFILSK